MRRILGSSKTLQGDSSGYIAHSASGSQVHKGYVVFLRKLANKMIEMAKSNEEIASFVESIPEWGDYANGELKQVNEI